MADIFDFYVKDNRKIDFEIAEPIMREDNGVTDFVFHIPKSINGFDMSDWAWWFVFVNAKNEKYSVLLTLIDEPDRPLEYNIATYTVDYAMSIKAGSVKFALEAINAGTGGAIDNEWHTLTYETKVKDTLQGNQAQFAETESDIISALIRQIQTKYEQLVGGATPLTSEALAQMDAEKSPVWIYTGDESDGGVFGDWYYFDGEEWQSGGAYAAGILIDDTLTQEGQAADAEAVGTQLSGKAPVISVVHSGKYTDFSTIGMIAGTASSVSAKGLGIARFVAYDDANRFGDFTQYNVMQQWANNSCVLSKDHLTLTGTSNKQLYLGKNNNSIVPLTAPIPSGSKVYFGIIVKGTSTGGSACKVTFSFYNESGTRISWNQVTPYDSTGWIGNATLSQKAYSVQMLIGKDETWTCDGLEVYPFIFATENKIISNDVIALDADYPLTITGWSKLSTAPYTHTFTYKSDTKTYIDNHTPDDYISTSNLPEYIPDYYVTETELEETLVYITPEMYGAAGDGTTDDTTALQAAIEAASQRSDYIKPILKGYGIYKTTQPLQITGSYLDIFIKAIKYTGNDAALIISAGNSVFTFNNVDATASGADGIRILASTDANARVNAYEGNLLVVQNRIISDANAIELIRTSDASTAIMYNTFRIQKMYSYNANCIYANTPVPGTIMENDFFGMNFIAPNGYAFYGNEFVKDTTIHDYCIENNVKNGIYGYAELYNCRTVECMNHYSTDEQDRGMIFVFDGIKPDNGAYSDDRTPVSLLSINVDNALTWDDLIEKTKDYYDANTVTPIRAFLNATMAGSWYSVFNNCYLVCESSFAGSTARLIHGKAYAYLNHVAFKPDSDWEIKIDSPTYEIELVRTPESAAAYITPTVFDINVSLALIYLDWSYCCIAINRFKVKQYADKKAKVYDKYGTLIFDGTMQDAGVYTFECAQTPIDGTVTMRDDSSFNFSTPSIAMSFRQVYNGENEEWTITKAQQI